MTENTLSPLWRSAWLNPLNDAVAWNTLLQTLNPLWSVTEARAKVLRIEWETADVFSLYLKPNRMFKGAQPGQHIAIQLQHNGALKSRTFSVSNAPNGNGVLRLTIKINPNGTLSKAASALQPGQVIGISQASGAFTPSESGHPLLLLSAGSGITPMMAMLSHWAKQSVKPDVFLVQCCRTEQDVIFAKELQTLVHQWPQLRVHLHFSQNASHLGPEQLLALVPDLAERETLLCGPEGFMAWVKALYQQHGLSAQLKQEHFSQLRFEAKPNAERFTVFNGQAQPGFTAMNGQSLLEAAEQNGLKPTHGCRRGICMTCQCRKLSGIVHNQLTNTQSSNGEEWIQLCISTPMSDLQIEMDNHGH